LTARNVTHAAELAGVAYRTLCRWLTQDQFRAALAQAESNAVDTAARRLAGLGAEAIDVISLVLLTAQSENVALRAAQAVLDNLLKLREQHALEKRLAALEAQVYGR